MLEDILDMYKYELELKELTSFIKESNLIEQVNSEEEIKQSIKAFRYLEKQKKLTINNICKTHEILMKNLLSNKEAGKIRNVDVWVANRKGCIPNNINSFLSMLLKKSSVQDGLDALDFHVSFEKIHPFIDGNGRIGRLIYYWQCKKIGIKSFIFRSKERQSYYDLF